MRSCFCLNAANLIGAKVWGLFLKTESFESGRNGPKEFLQFPYKFQSSLLPLRSLGKFLKGEARSWVVNNAAEIALQWGFDTKGFNYCRL